MKDFAGLMKQAQAMQEKMQAAQARISALEVDGISGGGMVRLTLKGTGELKSIVIEKSLLDPNEGEIVADLIVAAHADGKRKLDMQQTDLMREVAGPLAGLPGMPGF